MKELIKMIEAATKDERKAVLFYDTLLHKVGHMLSEEDSDVEGLLAKIYLSINDIYAEERKHEEYFRKLLEMMKG